MSTPQHLSTTRTQRTPSTHEPKHAIVVARDWHPLRRYLATGAVSALLICAFALPATAIAADDFTETVKIEAETEDVTAEFGNITVADGTGMDVLAENGYSATVSSGPITSGGFGTSMEYTGVYAGAAGSGSSATVTVNGAVQASQHGVCLETYNGSSVEVTVNGDISTEQFEGLCLLAKDGLKTEATVNGGISSPTLGVYAAASGENSLGSFTVNGPIQAGEFGQVIQALNGSTIKSTVVGDIASKTQDGIRLEADNGSTIKSTVTGNIASEGQDGIHVETRPESTIESTVTGSIASKKHDGIDLEVNGGTVKATVTGNISAAEGGVFIRSVEKISSADVVVNGTVTGTLYGVLSSAGGSINNTIINGDVKSDNHGIFVGSYTDYYGEGGTVNITVNGDITSGDTGFYFNADDKSAINAIITGTLSGEEAGVAIYNGPGFTAHTMDLTVWRIVPNGGAVAFDGNYVDGKHNFTQNEAFEKTIKYIVKIEQPEAGATLSATDAAGNPLPTSHEYEYALEGENVLLKVNLEDGYSLKGAYNGLGEKASLLVDDTGNYYVVVPKGGGVYLSVELEKVAPKPTPEPVPAKAPSTGTTPSAASTMPATGDPTDIAFPLVLTALSAAAASSLALRKRGNHERR